MLVVANVYPLPHQPTLGMFVAEQVESLRARDDVARVDVLVVDGISSRANYARGALGLRRLERRLRPDIVHAHYGLTGAVALAGTRGRPLIVTYHGSDVSFSSWQRAISRVVARRATRNLCVSRSQLSLLGAPAEHVPCGIDLARISPRPRAEARAAWGVPEGALALLFPGQRWRPVKHYPGFVAVRRALERRGVAVAELRLEDVPRERVPELFAAADVLVMTSLSEGSPVSIMEALACGLPVVAPPVGEVPAMLEGIPSARVLPFSPERFADAALELRRPGTRAPAAEATQYDLRQVAARLAGIYREVLRRS